MRENGTISLSQVQAWWSTCDLLDHFALPATLPYPQRKTILETPHRAAESIPYHSNLTAALCKDAGYLWFWDPGALEIALHPQTSKCVRRPSKTSISRPHAERSMLCDTMPDGVFPPSEARPETMFKDEIEVRGSIIGESTRSLST